MLIESNLYSRLFLITALSYNHVKNTLMFLNQLFNVYMNTYSPKSPLAEVLFDFKELTSTTYEYLLLFFVRIHSFLVKSLFVQ